MTIELKKILTISAGDWFMITGENPRNYEVKGIHVSSSYSPYADEKHTPGFKGCNPFELKQKLSEYIDNNVEVIVNYRTAISRANNSYHAYLEGTALIPKK